MDTLLTLFSLVFMLALGGGIGWWFSRAKRQPEAPVIHSTLEEIRAVGELSAFKAITKEIITETGHTFGDFGRKYLSWAFSKKKLCMIFEFEMDFRYDLRRTDCEISNEIMSTGGRRAVIVMPPCAVSVGIRNLYFYDEQRAKMLPWLLPSLIGEAFGSGFDEADKNRLIASAKSHATLEAEKLAVQLRDEVERSARGTLSALALSLGSKEVAISFRQSNQPIPEANYLLAA
jgi:Protein of unknown function (DUF4230)